MSDRAIILTFVAMIVVGFALWSANYDYQKTSCEKRGGWFTVIGGYPSCLPVGRAAP